MKKISNRYFYKIGFGFFKKCYDLKFIDSICKNKLDYLFTLGDFEKLENDGIITIFNLGKKIVIKKNERISFFKINF